ncbi:MAG: hypothetical protein H7Y37_14750, partial [Anaerolineae bacterium]|nr:hypothetical protein [Gloeobacterales cyanobacterium ES-bin-313]
TRAQTHRRIVSSKAARKYIIFDTHDRHSNSTVPLQKRGGQFFHLSVTQREAQEKADAQERAVPIKSVTT